MQIPKLSLLGQCCPSFCYGLWGDDALIMPSVRSLSIAERCAHICKDETLFCRRLKLRSLVPVDHLTRHFRIAFCMVTGVSMNMQFHRWVSVIEDQHGLALWFGTSLSDDSDH